MQETQFLENFEPLRRSLIANMFCYAVRAGARTVPHLLLTVSTDLENRLAERWTTVPVRQSLEMLRALLNTPAGREYAEYIIAWEALPKAEKDRIKAARTEEFRAQRLESQPPTEAQLRYLASLGHTGETPTSKRQASQLIDGLLKRTGKDAA